MINPFETIKPIEAYQREAEEFEARKRQRMMEEQLMQGKLSMLPFEQQKMQAEVKALQEGRGANVPATIQIANEMQRALQSGDTARYNMLNQVHKTMDRGLQVDPTTGQIVPMQGYGPAIGAISADKAGMSRQAEKNVDIVMNPQIAGGEAEARLLQQLQYDPAIKRAVSAQEGLAEIDTEKAKKSEKAEIMLNLVQEAEGLLPNATSGAIGRGITGTQKFFGKSTDASKADARLKVIAAGLTSNVPRMEGPQGVLDVELYKQAAGDVANSEIPYEDRLSAIQTIKDLQNKYAGNNPSGIQLDTPAPPMQPMDKYSQEEAQFNERKGKGKIKFMGFE